MSSAQPLVGAARYPHATKGEPMATYLDFRLEVNNRLREAAHHAKANHTWNLERGLLQAAYGWEARLAGIVDLADQLGLPDSVARQARLFATQAREAREALESPNGATVTSPVLVPRTHPAAWRQWP